MTRYFGGRKWTLEDACDIVRGFCVSPPGDPTFFWRPSTDLGISLGPGETVFRLAAFADDSAVVALITDEAESRVVGSVNGVSWTFANSLPAHNTGAPDYEPIPWMGLTATETEAVAVLSTGRAARAVRTDGSYTDTVPYGTEQYPYAAAYGAGITVLVSATPSAPTVYTTDPTGSWSAAGSVPGSLQGVYSAVFHKGTFTVFGYNMWVRSTNGSSWTAISGYDPQMPAVSAASNGDVALVRMLLHIDGEPPVSMFSKSYDGVNWSGAGSVPGAWSGQVGVMPNGVFVSISAAGTYYSDDEGSTWKPATGPNVIMTATTSFQGRLIAFDQNGVMYEGIYA